MEQQMPNFNVTIEARIIKTLSVEAATEDEAIVIANGEFSVLPESGVEENYEQDTLEVTLVG
jgi:hypothetical protein